MPFSYWQRDIYSALYMLGMLFGSYFFGWVSDKYGRKNALMASIITVSISGFLGYDKFLAPGGAQGSSNVSELFVAEIGVIMATVS